MTTPDQSTNDLFQVDDDSLDLKRYLSLFISNWYWFAISIFFTLSIAYAINRWSEKLYTVTSTMLIKDELVGGGTSGIEKIIPGGDIFRSKQNLKNEIGILKSFSLNYRVIQDLPDFHIVYKGIGRRGIVETQMYKTCPFIVKYDLLNIEPQEVPVFIEILSDTSYSLKINDNLNISKILKFGDRFNDAGFNFTIKMRDSITFKFNETLSNKYFFYFINPATLANQYRSQLNIQPIAEDASLIILSTSGSVKEQEADYLNTLMEHYILQGLEYKNLTADSTMQFIDNQLKIISDSLSLAEIDLEKFRIENKFVDLGKEGSIILSRFETVHNEKAAIELQKLYYNYLLDYVLTKNETNEIITPSMFGIRDEGLVNLINKLSDLQDRKRTLGFNLSSDLPAIALLDKEIENTRSVLYENLKNSLDQIQISLDDIKRRTLTVEEDIDKLPITERKMIRIQRKFDLNNTVFTYLMEKRAEAGIAKASNVPDNRIIDSALTGNATIIKPKIRQNKGLALILGLLFPALAIMLIDFLNNKVIDKKDIEILTKVPILGYISHNDHKTEIPVIGNSGSAIAESFRSVRTSLRYFIKEDKHPIITVSSTISAEGKTFFSTNLAASLSLLGKKILLIGLDLRKPRIHKIFKLDNDKGLTNFLIGECSLNEIILETDYNNLYYIPSGPVPPNPAELIDSESMKNFLDTVKKIYDYIIIDTPPVAVVTDALLLASFASMNIFVVRQRFSSRNTIGLIDDLNKEGNLKNMCIIVNDINLSGYYGYGLRYGYSIGSGYAYGYNYYGKYSKTKYGYSDSSDGYYKDQS